eukprot:scpid51080/ scgid26078/ Fibrillin-1
MLMAIRTSIFLLLILHLRYAFGFDGCNPACLEGKTCVNSTSCRYVMTHAAGSTNFVSRFFVSHQPLATVEYHDDCSDQWLPAQYDPIRWQSSPIRIFIAVGQKGTYFRSRITVVTQKPDGKYTLSIKTTGQPPKGYPIYHIPSFPRIVSATAVPNNTNLAIVSLSLPTIEGSSHQTVEFGNPHIQVEAEVNTSTHTVSRYFAIDSNRREFMFRTSSMVASGTFGSSTTMGVYFSISDGCIYKGEFYQNNEQFPDSCGPGNCTCKNGVMHCPASPPCQKLPCSATDQCCQTCPTKWINHVDDCSDPGMNDCSSNATCRNTYVTFTCTCHRGFYGNGKTCTECKDDPHSLIVGGRCDTGLEYIQSSDVRCPLDSTTGYWEGREHCKDIDECSTDTHKCSSSASCTNTFASFTCVCKAGFRGDGVICNEIDECRNGTHNCHASATCNNTVGSFTCACNNGFSGTGQQCKDIDECSGGSHQCTSDSKCANTLGSFKCACNAGFYVDGIGCKEATKCDEACGEISALPIVYANATRSNEICQGRKSPHHISAKAASWYSDPCVSAHFQNIGVPLDTPYWTSRQEGVKGYAPRYVPRSTMDMSVGQEFLVVCLYQSSYCKRTQCRQTCSDISIFPLFKVPSRLAESFCRENLQTLGNNHPEYISAAVASVDSENYGCVSRHLQEYGMSDKLVFGGYGKDTNGALMTSNRTFLHPNEEAYVVCEYRKQCRVTQCKPTCSEISIFPLRVATAATANQVCAGSAFAKKYAQEFARVASAISEIFQCVTRHLQE